MHAARNAASSDRSVARNLRPFRFFARVPAARIKARRRAPVERVKGRDQLATMREEEVVMSAVPAWRPPIRGLALPLLFAGCSPALMFFDAEPREEGIVRIRITADYTFEPKEAVAVAGDRVIWTNDSPVEHRISGDPRPVEESDVPGESIPFRSTRIPPSESYQRFFSVPGSYTYFCPDHGSVGMTGRIVVRRRRAP
jgi:plastocyanin